MSFSACPKTKAGWLVEAIEFITSDHDAFALSNLFYTITFDMHIPKVPNLGFFVMQMFMLELKTVQLFQLLLLEN